MKRHLDVSAWLRTSHTGSRTNHLVPSTQSSGSRGVDRAIGALRWHLARDFRHIEPTWLEFFCMSNWAMLFTRLHLIMPSRP